MPIAFSLLRFVPCPSALRSKFNAWIIDSPLFGSVHNTSVVFGLSHIPTRGQALFIFYFIVINTVFCAVGCRYANPNTYYPDDRFDWMVMVVSNRIGLLSYANLPLVFLYAGRNNLLLWLTSWSHSTFLLLHRWIAAIATLEAILHSLIYLYKYAKNGTHASESKLPYWYWGVVATLGMTILFPLSVLPFRKKFYELFLLWHIVIAILVIAGTYWHIVFDDQHQWGYETWIIITMGFWAFDRVFRFLRLVKDGVKTAEVTVIDHNYIRVCVPDVHRNGHAYLYFPTLTWRFWESHPFSIASTILPSSNIGQAQHSPKPANDIEKQSNFLVTPVRGSSDSHTSSSKEPVQAGITFYVRTQTGITLALRNRTSLPVLIEAGYSSHSPSSLHMSPTLVALTGGVGITAVLPHLCTHPGRVKLYWGCRTQALIDDVRSTGALATVEHEVFVGTRMAIREILESELVDGAKSEVCVLVSGPAAMIDEVRNTVGEIVKKGKEVMVNLMVESFSW
jgi:hypothetical protein